MIKIIPFKSLDYKPYPPLITKAIISNFNSYNFILRQSDTLIITPSTEKEEKILFLNWIIKHLDFNLLKIFVKKTNHDEFIIVNSQFIKFINTIKNLNEKKIKRKFNSNYNQNDLNYIVTNIKMIDVVESDNKTNLKIQYLYYLLTHNSLRTIIFNKDDINYSVIRINTIKILKLLLCYISIKNLTNIITHRILSEIK